jgi:hypothetical protein
MMSNLPACLLAGLLAVRLANWLLNKICNQLAGWRCAAHNVLLHFILNPLLVNEIHL